MAETQEELQRRFGMACIKKIDELGAREVHERIPAQLITMLVLMDKNSDFHDRNGANQLAATATELLREHIRSSPRDRGTMLESLKVTPETLYDTYKDVVTGIVDAAKHYGEEAKLAHISQFALIPPPPKASHAYGSAYVDPKVGGVTILIHPELLKEKALSHAIGKDPRRLMDPKFPGKYFNAAEAARMTGIEEAVHAQQMLEGRFTPEYNVDEGVDEETYEAAECEKEAAQVQAAVVEENNMGSDQMERGSHSSDLKPSPKARADLRKAMKKRQKKGKGGGGGKPRR